MMSIPETTNAMLRYLNEELEKRERENGKEIALVRPGTGNDDAGPEGQRRKGVSSLLLVYEHPKTWTDQKGNEHTFVNRTIQYNPRHLEKASTKSSRIDVPGSKDPRNTPGSYARPGSPSCLRFDVRELVEPMPVGTPGMQALWMHRCEARHAQRMMFEDNVLQLSFDFGDHPR